MTDRARVVYAREPTIEVGEFRRVLVESGLGSIRPVGDEERLREMIAQANLIVTARLEDGTLVGVGRGMSDSSWCCYVSDLAVSRNAQGLGIGQRLLEEARRAVGPRVSLILVSVPEAVGFYERAGMTALPHAFWYKRTE